jgi:hypothetical protein
MLDIIKASLDQSPALAKERAINEGAEMLEGIFGPSYPIADLCQMLDYGGPDGERNDGIREMQYAQIIGSLAQLMGIDFNEYLSESGLCLANIRALLWAGKFDAFIYQ